MSPLTMAKVPYRVIRPSPMRVFNPPPSDGSSLFRPSRALAMARDPYWRRLLLLARGLGLTFAMGVRVISPPYSLSTPLPSLSSILIARWSSPPSRAPPWHQECLLSRPPPGERSGARSATGERQEGGASCDPRMRERRSSMRPPSAIGERARERRRESDGGLVTCSGWWHAPVEKKIERGVE